MNTLSVLALPTPARSQPRALRPHLLPRPDLAVGSPVLGFLPATPSQCLPIAVTAPLQELCVPSSASERQCEAWKALQALWQHLERGQWCLGLSSWKLSAAGGDREAVPKASSFGNQQQRSLMPGGERTGTGGQAWGPLLLMGSGGPSVFSHLPLAACLWAAILLWGTIQFTKPSV